MSLSDCRPEQHFLVTLGIFSFLPARKLCLGQLEEIIRGWGGGVAPRRAAAVPEKGVGTMPVVCSVSRLFTISSVT